MTVRLTEREKRQNADMEDTRRQIWREIGGGTCHVWIMECGCVGAVLNQHREFRPRQFRQFRDECRSVSHRRAHEKWLKTPRSMLEEGAP